MAGKNEVLNIDIISLIDEKYQQNQILADFFGGQNFVYNDFISVFKYTEIFSAYYHIDNLKFNSGLVFTSKILDPNKVHQIKEIKTGKILEFKTTPPYKASGGFLFNLIDKGSYSVFRVGLFEEVEALHEDMPAMENLEMDTPEQFVSKKIVWD